MLKSVLFSHCKTRKGVSGSEIVVPEAIFSLLLRLALRSIPFDEEWYLSENPDVQVAIDSGELRSGKDHFVMQGYLEGRLPSKITVDEKFYADSYADINQAFERGEIKSLSKHFYETGRFEGRLPSANFSLFPPI